MTLVRMLALILALASGSFATAEGIIERGERDEIFSVEAQDADMLAAFDKARATLDTFLTLARSRPAGASAFGLKVKIVDGSKVEYFWVHDFAQRRNSFTGRISNTPRSVTTVRLGQRIRFSRADIHDWVYVDRGRRRMNGNFTACALLTKEPQAEQDAFKREYGLACDR